MQNYHDITITITNISYFTATSYMSSERGVQWTLMAMASSSPEGFKQAGSIVRLKFINFMQVVCFDLISTF